MTASSVTPAQRQLAAALRTLQGLQDQGRGVIRSSDLSRQDRQILVSEGFLEPIVKGWFFVSRPGDAPGDTTPWYAAMGDFVATYCNTHFGQEWHVSPAHSIQVHAGSTTLPKQVIVHSPHGSNNIFDLPHGCSLLHYQAPAFPAADQIEVRGGLRVLALPVALVRVPEAFFQAGTDAQIALTGLPDASDLNRELLAGGHSVVAGRLAGALHAIGRPAMADDIVGAMRAAGYTVYESNPFLSNPPILQRTRVASPYVYRLQLMWHMMRREVVRHFPQAPGLPNDVDAYLAAVQENYRADAYHSLSIEGYRVTNELIERVATGTWNPEKHASDADARNAMAAHGYWRAFEEVKQSLRRVLTAENPGEVAREDHGGWYRALFSPSVTAGLLKASDLAGYRNMPVYIKNALHVPPPREAVREMMPALFDLLHDEPSAAVRAVLGHFCFVFIHPYMDGNGRVGRYLMNAMLAAGGYPWTIIRVEWRDEYLAALNAASAHSDIGPFAQFLANAVRATLEASDAASPSATPPDVPVGSSHP